MKAFAFRTIELKQPREQMQIIEDHKAIVTFSRLDANRCMMAAKLADIAALMQKMVPKTSKPRQTRRTRSAEPVRISAPPTVETVVVLFFLRSPAQVALFAVKNIEERIFSFIKRTFQVQTEITPSSNANQREVKISGVRSAIEGARKYLLNFSSFCRTKVYDDVTGKIRRVRFKCPLSLTPRSDHPWIRIQDAAYVVQYDLESLNVICVCEHQMNPLSIQIHYIDRSQTEFGVSEHVLDVCCLKRLSFVSIPLPYNSPFHSEWTHSLNEIRSDAFHQQTISLTVDNGMILLFGAPNLMQSYQQRFQQLWQEEIDHQPAEQRRAAARPPSPPARTVVKPVWLNFTIDQPGFESLLSNQLSRLTGILPVNCTFKKEISIIDIPVEVPLSLAQQIEPETTATTVANQSFWRRHFRKRSVTTSPSSPALPQPSTSLRVGRARISVCQGDLRTQQVERIGFLLRSSGNVF